MKDIKRIANIFVEFQQSDAYLLVMSDPRDKIYRTVEARLEPLDQVELIKLFRDNVTKLIEKKACCVCKHFERYTYDVFNCLLDPKERNECRFNNYKFFEPVEIY